MKLASMPAVVNMQMVIIIHSDGLNESLLVIKDTSWEMTDGSGPMMTMVLRYL